MEKGGLSCSENKVIPVGNVEGVDNIKGHEGLLGFVELLEFIELLELLELLELIELIVELNGHNGLKELSSFKKIILWTLASFISYLVCSRNGGARNFAAITLLKPKISFRSFFINP